MRTTHSSRHLVANEPNAAHLFESLRYSGYANQEALADIIDNSFDAGAQNVWINFKNPTKNAGDVIIDIYDDGEGMDKDTLDEALKLGSNSNKSVLTQLGKAGMGLKTAGSSIARKIEVFTKQKDSNTVYYSCYSGQLMEEHNKFVKILREADKHELSELQNNYEIDQSKNEKKAIFIFSRNGTLIRLSECDNFKSKNINHFKGTLKHHLGEVFRKYLNAGKKIYIDQELVPINDPLFILGEEKSHFEGESPRVHERNIELNIDGKKVTYDVRISELPETTQTKAKLLDINIRNQGFYIMRNNRQIARAKTLGIFTKHNDYNRIRVEVSFSGEMDELMGLNFAKQEIQPSHQIIDALKEKIYNPIISQAKKLTSSKKRIELVKEKPVEYTTAEKTFKKKGSILVKPIPSKNENAVTITKKVKEIESNYPEKKGDISGEEPVKFINDSSLSVDDLFFKCEQVGETTIVYLNVKHPFFQSFIDLEEEAREPLQFLIGSIAMATLRLDEDQQALIEQQVLREVSLNLRQLLS